MGWYGCICCRDEFKLQEWVPATHIGSWNVRNLHGTRNMWAMCNKFLFWDWVLGPGCSLLFWQGLSDLNMNFSKLLGAASPFVQWSYRLLNGQFLWNKSYGPIAWHNEMPRVCLSEQIVAQERETRTIGQHKPAGALRFGALGKRSNLLTGNLCGFFSGRFGPKVVHGQTCSTTIGWSGDWLKTTPSYMEPSGMRNSGCTWMVRSLLVSTELANLSDYRAVMDSLMATHI